MIRSLQDIADLARQKGPVRVAVLAPEDEEFMLAVKMSWQKGFVEPVLIGCRERIEQVSEKVGFDTSRFEVIPNNSPQSIADLGIGMVFSGETPIASKGQIPTSYIYRSIIREEAKAGSGMNVSVISFWDVPGLDHLVAFTDTGVNIRPDAKTKLEILKNALFVYRLLGCSKPQIAVLSGQRPIGGTIPSYHDFELIRKAADSGDLGECELTEATSFTEIFVGKGKRIADCDNLNLERMPHILLVPCLDTGNILCKLDFFLNVSRCSLVATSRGPICIPARSDPADSIVEQLALCVVVADRMRSGK
jgi:phosphate butyryltransferase